MDQQNYYYGKHNIGTLNYQAVFANSGSEYQTTSFNEHQPIHHSTGLNFNASSNSANSTCSDLSSTTSAANLTRSSNNTVNANSSINEYNSVPYSRLYSYIPDNNVQNATSSAPSNAPDCNNITYGSAFSSKSYESTSNSAHVPVIAVTSNSSHSRSYHSTHLGSYGSYQNIDYSLHKPLSQNYVGGSIVPSPSSITSTQSRSALNSSTAFTPMEHIAPPTAKGRSNSNNEGKTSAKTSVIKPLNAYNANASASGTAPLNYTKYVPSYPIYANNNKTVPTMEKSPSTVNRAMYLNSSANHKNPEVFCPEPIPAARYSNPSYAINVTTPSTGHTNSHYLTASSYPLNYGHHHLSQHHTNVPHHPRNLLSASAYQTSLDDSASANYFNRQNGLVVRPTPNTYKQSQIAYQNAYNYGRANISSATCGVNSNHSSNVHSTLPKPQSQKPIDDSYNSFALEFDNPYTDRRNFRQYSSVYGANYIDPAGYEDYSQYSGFSSTNSSSVPFYAGKSTPKHLLYNYNAGLNMYNSNTSHVQLSSQTSQSTAISSSSSSLIPTSSTTTVVQQPVPINPSSSQLISSNYDASSLHTHPILPPSLFNNNTKEFCSPNQYQQNPYASQILYSTLQNGYYSMKPNQSTFLPSSSSETHGLQDKVPADKSMPTQPTKYTVIDLEEQINSSKIPKVTSGPVISNAKLNQRANEFGSKMPAINVQDNVRQRKSTSISSSQNDIESNKSSYAYNNGSYNHCYQSQQQLQQLQQLQQQQQQQHQQHHQWTKTVSSATTLSHRTHLHPKKQNLRDFLSTWNEDEEEEVDSMSKKFLNIQSSASVREPLHGVSDKGARHMKPNKSNDNVPVIVQPIVQPAVQPKPQIQASHLSAALNAAPSYPCAPIPNIPLVPPKIHLPDIISDIEKPTKVGGEGESFERTNGELNLKISMLLR